MSSLVDQLVKLDQLRREEKARQQAPRDLKQAAKSLETARRNLAIDLDWALSIAYAAALQAGHALIHAHGARPNRGEGQHVVVIQVVRGLVTEIPADRLKLFELLRRQRHRAQYGAAGAVTRRHAEDAVAFAEEIVAAVGQLLSGGDSTS